MIEIITLRNGVLYRGCGGAGENYRWNISADNLREARATLKRHSETLRAIHGDSATTWIEVDGIRLNEDGEPK